MAQATRNNTSAPLTPRLVRLLREAALYVLGAIAIYLLVALWTYQPSDPSWSYRGPSHTVQNAGGWVGAWVADVMLSLFGYVAYLLPIMVALLGWRIFEHRKDEIPPVASTASSSVPVSCWRSSAPVDWRVCITPSPASRSRAAAGSAIPPGPAWCRPSASPARRCSCWRCFSLARLSPPGFPGSSSWTGSGISASTGCNVRANLSRRRWTTSSACAPRGNGARWWRKTRRCSKSTRRHASSRWCRA